jgi:solute:Na+ symporter, SSS family
LYTVIFTTICWVTTAFLPRLETNRKTLIEFCRKVRPFGRGWECIRKEVHPTPDEIAAVDHTNIPLALLGWLAGSVMIWSSLFMIGNYRCHFVGGSAAQPSDMIVSSRMTTTS